MKRTLQREKEGVYRRPTRAIRTREKRPTIKVGVRGKKIGYPEKQKVWLDREFKLVEDINNESTSTKITNSSTQYHIAKTRIKKALERTTVRVEEPIVWEEDIVRIGTGYRVHRLGTKEGKTTREFDVGYGEKQLYTRKEGVTPTIDKTQTGRKRKAEGKGSRELVINEVCNIESRRKISKYTGYGISRKSRVGKKKLKPTKAVPVK